jgi:hypothetical protein
MQRLTAAGLERRGADDWLYDVEAAVLAYSGHLQQARMMSHRAIEIARQAERNEAAAQHEAGAAVREVLFGNVTEARHAAQSAQTLSNGREVQYGAAVALAFAGNSSQAQILADDLERRFPADTSVRFGSLPTLHALIALNRHDPLGAAALLETATPFELGWRGANSVGFCGSLYPLYVRGEAFLMAHRGVEAAAEFQNILDHRGIIGADPIGALARLQLGRAFILTGDTHRAMIAYQDFLTLWKDADPDIPVLANARAEYARLRGRE